MSHHYMSRFSKVAIGLIFLAISSTSLDAREGTPPKSQTENLGIQKTQMSTIELPAIDTQKQLRINQKKPYESKPLRFATPNDMTVTPETHGTWTDIKGGKIWQLRFTSKGATDVNFGFSKYSLPEGAMLHILSFADDPVYYDGPYTIEDNRSYNQFWSAPVPGGDVAIELFLPEGSESNYKLELTRVSTGFRDVFKRYGGAGLKGGQGSCNNDVICPVGDAWRDEIRSVAAYTVSGIDTCSGTLVMDADRTFTPHFLTAFHCGVTAGNAAQMVTIWNYEAPVCGTNSGGSRLETVSGAIFRARRQDVDSGLVELSSTPPESFNVYYAGWDRSGNIPSGSVGIHHPSVAEKSISFNDDALTTVNNCIGGGGSNTHWQVDNWEDGTTEPGSSGSAIFDPNNKLVVGFLSGGTASCTSITSDCYGKFSEGWDDGGIDSLNLGPWLDPSDTGVMTVAGSNPSPFAIQSTPETLGICAGDDAAYNLDILQNDPLFTEQVTLSTTGTPGATTSGFSNNPVTPPSTSMLTIGNTGAVTPGSYMFDVVGTSTSETRDKTLELIVNNAAPNQITLTAPADTATGVGTLTSYTWAADAAATSYTIEVATDAGFTNIVDSATVPDASYNSAFSLNPNTQYFWRVTAANACGVGTTSAVFSFTTANEICVAPGTSIPDDDPAGIDTMLTAGDVGQINSMQFSLQVSHTWVGDLIATLSHGGTSVTLMDRPGVPATTNGCNQADVDAVFDDTSGTPVENECSGTPPAIGGTVAPEQPLAAFNGANAIGDWTLNISDNVGLDTGTVDAWCLILDTQVLEETIFEDQFEDAPPPPP